MRGQKMYYVKLKDDHNLLGLDELLEELELGTYEERFPIEDIVVEFYKKGTLQECSNFIKSINNESLKTQFEIVKK